MTTVTSQLPAPRRNTAWLVGLILINLGLLIGSGYLLHKNSQADRNNVDGIQALVAKVNGQPIYARDLLSSVRISSESIAPKNLRRHLQEMIEAEVVSQKAGSVAVSDLEIEERWQAMTYPFENRENLSTAAQKFGTSEAKIRERIRKNLRAELWLRKVIQVEPTSRELHEWYDAHFENFALPEVAEATHFASIFPPRGTPLEFLAKGNLIRDTLKQLKAGTPLAQLIEVSSDDPAIKMTGGSLGWFCRERIDPVIAEAAFSLPIGEISRPLQTRFGFHLLTVTGRRSASTLSYEESEAEVRQRCRDEMQQKKCAKRLAN